MRLADGLVDLIESALDKEMCTLADPGTGDGPPSAESGPGAASVDAGEPKTTCASTGPVAVIRRGATTAWVLAVFPADTDPLLVASARVHAAPGTRPASGPQPGKEGAPAFPDPRESEPTDAPALSIVVLGLAAQSALAWVTSTPLSDAQRAGLTARAAGIAPTVRALLPGSRSLAVVGLEPEARALFEHAAQIAADQVVDQVQLAHLAAAMLAEGQLTRPPDGLCPEPDDAALALLTGVGDGSAGRAALRSRIIEALRLSTLGADPGLRAAPSDRSDGLGRLALLRGVRVLSPGERTEVTGPDPTQLPTDQEEAAIHAAALDLAVHLGRSDVPGPVLAGPAGDRRAVLSRLATLMQQDRIPVLAGRDLVHVDPSAVAKGRDQQLGDLVARHAGTLALALEHPSLRLGLSLIAAARGGAAPVVLLTEQDDPLAEDPSLGDAPVVRIGRSGSGGNRGDLTAELRALAVEIAAAHRVALTAGVAPAAAAPAPDRPHRSTRDDPFADLDDPGPQSLDPVALGRARLEYACARAALRPDRTVRPGDVPADPRRGLAQAEPRARLAGGAQLLAQLGERIIDQPHVVATLTERLQFAARGLRRTGPRSTLLLAGPPGTGKTHTAAAVAEVYYGDPEAIIRIDCGALFERHTITALLGAPPSYVGHAETSGLLTTRITERQGQVVVLFDEIEKAHPRVLDLLLSVLDSGTLVDFSNRSADATPSIFLLTSNLGSASFARQATGFADATAGQQEAAVRSAVRDHLRPELLDRLDDVLVYRPLSSAGVAQLTGQHLAELTSMLAADGYDLSIGADLVDELAGRVQSRGVRGLRRYLESALLRHLLTHPPGQYHGRLGPDGVQWSAAEPAQSPADAPEPRSGTEESAIDLRTSGTPEEDRQPVSR